MIVYTFFHHIQYDNYNTLKHVHVNNFIDMFYYAIILYNNKIINLYFKCEGDPSASFLPFYITVALPPDGGRNYQPKHVVVNVMNKLIYSLVNKANLGHNLFVLYLSISTSFG